MSRLAESLNLLTVQTAALSGTRLDNGEVKGVAITLNIDWAVYSKLIVYRFHMTVGVYSVETEPRTGDLGEIADRKLADIAATILSEYAITDGREVDPDATAPLQEFAQHALAEAAPYLRESVSSTASRLGFPNVTIQSLHMPTISSIPTSA